MNDLKWLARLIGRVPKLLVAMKANPWPACTLMMFVLALMAIRK